MNSHRSKAIVAKDVNLNTVQGRRENYHVLTLCAAVKQEEHFDESDRNNITFW